MIMSSSVRMTRTWAWRVLVDATREDKCVLPTEMAQYHPSLRSLDDMIPPWFGRPFFSAIER